MTNSTTVTGNETRDTLLIAAITEVQTKGEPMTLANVAIKLPDDFDTDQVELDAMLAAMQPKPPVEEAQEPTPPIIPLDEVQNRIIAMNNELAHARGDYLTHQARLRDARGRVSRCISAFQIGLSPMTPLDNIKAHIASETAMRAARARGEVTAENAGINRPGPSLVDRLAHGHGSRHGTRRDSWRRGAYGAHSRGLVKLPSGG